MEDYVVYVRNYVIYVNDYVVYVFYVIDVKCYVIYVGNYVVYVENNTFFKVEQVCQKKEKMDGTWNEKCGRKYAQ